MKWSAWWLSCKLAWDQVPFRILSLLTVIGVLVGTIYVVGQVIAGSRHHGTMATHYNVYVGIDNVSEWQWSLLFPLVWMLIVAFNIFLSYIFYRRDPQAATSLLLFSALACIPWMTFLFYLTVLNR